LYRQRRGGYDSGGTGIKLYRAVELKEWADIQATGAFRPGPPSFQGKWFAERPDDAAEWGRRFAMQSGDTYGVVEVEIPDDVAAPWFYLPNLDGIGPARFVDVDQLPVLNQTHAGIREVP
jgi:hypothetical protein